MESQNPLPDMAVLKSAQRLALLGAAVNVLLAIIKITAGVVGNAYALIADGVESILDIGGSIVIWGGLKMAEKPPDETHPYGHGKAEPVAAALVALIVLLAAAGLAVESMKEILTPHHTPAPFTLWVLILVIVVKEGMYRFVGRRSGESTAVQTDAWHHRCDAITSATAFIGISIALIGGEGYEAADDYAALFACALIGFNGVNLLLPALHEVMDRAAPQELRDALRSEALTVPGVVEVETLHVRKMGVEYFVDIHVEVDGTISVREGHVIAHAVKDRLREFNPAVRDVLVHVEPA